MISLWRDKNGQVVIWQKPNLALIVWFVSFILVKLPLPAQVSQVLSAIAFGAIVIWAGLEIFSGVNLFRRLLGLGVMIYSLASLLG